MSKAFTREDAEQPEVVRKPRPVGPRYLTPEGLAALEAELRGPLAAARAEELRALLEVAEVVPARAEGEVRAYFGAWVEVEDEEGQIATYRLVGPDEADARVGRVSVDSPLGRALLGREAGDTVVVERPRGRTELTVIAVRYRPPSP